MFLNPKKFAFGLTQGKLLGHIVSKYGINIDPERITTILNLPAPTSKKEIQSFMGRINFVRRFFPNFTMMVKPIHNMQKHDQSFSWTKDVKNDFVGVKKEISSTPLSMKMDSNK
jgi:hypothetical protein